ncbi:MAG TPA: DUF202 domain-containing protein [Usitatibacter sp.]|nr:DUF202 domain-containing protein [Usitatibacter sp.]
MNAAFSPGLQRERTAMAWTRTGLAVLANALIVLRAGLNGRQVFVLALGSMLMIGAGAAFACAAWRSRRLARGANPATPVLLVATMVGIAWVASVGAIAAIVTTAH